MKIDFNAKSDTGRVRKENQDSFGFLVNENFFYVCDGMGGGAAGDFASRAAVDVINSAFRSLTEQEVSSIMITPAFFTYVLRPAAAVRLANRALHNLTVKYPNLSGMGTTFAGVMFDQDKDIVHIYHVGDSRVYRVRNGDIELLTKDHSKINELIEQGKMSEDEIKTAEIQSMITRALGTGPTVKIDYKIEKMVEGDYYVLCTDGLNGELDDKTIRDIVFLHRDSVELIAKELINRANDCGGKDNTTVLVAKVVEGNTATQQAESLIVFGEEMQKQTAEEDRLLSRIMRKCQVEVPKAAREKSILSHPIIVGIVLATILSVSVFYLLNTDRNVPENQLIDMEGKLAGIRLEVRTPTQEQIDAFKKMDDVVQKLQMIQDWMKDKSKLTLPLENVQILIDQGGKDLFKGLTSGAPMDIQLPKGQLTVHLNYPGYRIINERAELKESIDVQIEQPDKYKNITLLMITE